MQQLQTQDPVNTAEILNDIKEWNVIKGGKYYEEDDQKIETALWDGKSLDNSVTNEEIGETIIDGLNGNGSDFRELMSARSSEQLLRAALELKDFLFNLSRRALPC